MRQTVWSRGMCVVKSFIDTNIDTFVSRYDVVTWICTHSTHARAHQNLQRSYPRLGRYVDSTNIASIDFLCAIVTQQFVQRASLVLSFDAH